MEFDFAQFVEWVQRLVRPKNSQEVTRMVLKWFRDFDVVQEKCPNLSIVDPYVALFPKDRKSVV